MSQNLLFICSRNQWRSPTAEKIFRKKGYNTRSAGTSPNAKRTLSHLDVKWADHIFVMETKHRNRVRANFPRLMTNKSIHVLDIPDEFRFMDSELISMLEQSVEPLLYLNQV